MRFLDFRGESFRSMGTTATLTLASGCTHSIDSVITQICEVFRGLEFEMSAYRQDNAIWELSAKAGVSEVTVSPDTYRVLDRSQTFAYLSEGAFDATSAPLVRLWGFSGGSKPRFFPSAEAIQGCVRLVDYHHLILRDGKAFLAQKGMAVDLGGIGKGYAVDCAYDLCRELGIQNFLFNFSGNIRASGEPARRKQWQIGVRNPFDRSAIIGKIALPDGMALATSGSYENFVDIGGRRFSHIIDPRTGCPVSGTAGVTTLTSDATTADALSTALFVVGLEGAHNILRKDSSTEVLIIPNRHPLELWMTPCISKRFTPIQGLRYTARTLQW
jgi:thiamine biosynthesis lipoprotein